MDFGAAWRTGPVLSLGRFYIADNRIHDAPRRQQLLALRGVQVLDCLTGKNARTSRFRLGKRSTTSSYVRSARKACPSTASDSVIQSFPF